jgi:dolichol-phosphate mannosyltransferase
MNKISIIIPILNEGENIYFLIKKIKENLKKIKQKYKFEIIFVDDNSTDNTHQILKKIKKNNIFFYIRKKEPDLSKSCMLGFDKARYDNVIVMDGDLQHNPKYIPKMIDLFFSKDLDFLICCRNFSKLLKKKNKTFFVFRTLLSFFLKYIFNFLVLRGGGLSDPMSGYFIFKREIYKKNKNRLFGLGYKILADLLTSENKKFKVFNLYINFDDRKKNKSKLNFNILILIFFLIIKRNRLFIKNSN